ncbi:hypothetical protein HPP92_003600 [Vanilla planifolia]|uniref:Uncharacterized protein n=1 Tax=Vanilla planifolia TaxID=51239 RepID=A0A835VNM7_VANPL|nr:hypothetical protein HPP92_003600 [Vanilla planifolia]
MEDEYRKKKHVLVCFFPRSCLGGGGGDSVFPRDASAQYFRFASVSGDGESPQILKLPLVYSLPGQWVEGTNKI